MLRINNTNLFCHQVAIYTGGSQLEWREVESGELPSPRFGLRAATIDNVIFVTGGQDDNQKASTAILSWDPPSESWKPAGDVKKARYYHAVVAITASIIESECSDML